MVRETTVQLLREAGLPTCSSDREQVETEQQSKTKSLVQTCLKEQQPQLFVEVSNWCKTQGLTDESMAQRLQPLQSSVQELQKKVQSLDMDVIRENISAIVSHQSRPLEEKLTQLQSKIESSNTSIAQSASPSPSLPISTSAPVQTQFSAPPEISAFNSQVLELKLRHEQHSKELDMLEIKLAQQMALSSDLQDNVNLLSTHVNCPLPQKPSFDKHLITSSSSITSFPIATPSRIKHATRNSSGSNPSLTNLAATSEKRASQ